MVEYSWEFERRLAMRIYLYMRRPQDSGPNSIHILLIITSNQHAYIDSVNRVEKILIWISFRNSIMAMSKVGGFGVKTEVR